MMIGGVIALLVLVATRMMVSWDDSLETVTIVWAALSVLACLVALIGCFTMRFELVGTANKALHATAAAPGS